MSRVSGKPYYLYVLWSEAGHRFYIGISENPQKRLIQHNQGQAGWTARFRPWKLVHTKHCDDYRTARKQEIELKSQKLGRGFFLRTGLDPRCFSSRPSCPGS